MSVGKGLRCRGGEEVVHVVVNRRDCCGKLQEHKGVYKGGRVGDAAGGAGIDMLRPRRVSWASLYSATQLDIERAISPL